MNSAQVQCANDISNLISQMLRRQPVLRRRRHQERLVGGINSIVCAHTCILYSDTHDSFFTHSNYVNLFWDRLLALHYVEDYCGLITRVHRWLAPEGILVFSTEHPITTSRKDEQGWTLNGSALYEDAYVKGADGQWRIQHTGYTRTYEEISQRAKTGAKVTESFWGERELKWDPV